MLKKMMLAASCLLPVVCAAQEKAIIRGTVDYDTPTKIYTLYYHKSTSNKSFDSVVVKDRKFSLSVPMYDNMTVSVMMYAGHGDGLRQEDTRDVKSFLVDKNGTDIHIKDTMKNAVLTNNGIEAEKARYTRYTYLAAADSAKMGFYINGTSPIVFDIQMTTPDSTDKAAWEQYQKTMANLRKMKELVQQKLVLAEKFAKENPDSYFSLSAVEDLGRYGKNPDDALALYNSLSARLRATPEGKAALATAEKAKDEKLHPEKKAAGMAVKLPPKPLADGQMAPDFTQYDVNGKAVKLSDFKGKYVLLDFWASWCVPCRAENPNLIKAYNQFKDRNFTILGIALEEKGSKQAWLNAIKKDGLTWPQVADLEKQQNAAADLFHVSGIPYNFLIDPNGRIIASNLRGELLADKLTEILSN